MPPRQPRRLVIDGRRLTAQRTGVGRYLESLLRVWSVSGGPLDHVIVVVQDPAVAELISDHTFVSVHVVGTGWPGLVWEWLGLGGFLRAGDVLFAPTNLIPSVWRGPTVLVIFDTLLEAVPEGFSRIVRWRFRGRYRSAARRASTIIVPSEATARDVERFYGVLPDRIQMIYPSIGPEFQPRAQDDPVVVKARHAVGLGEAPFFLFVGKRSQRRNVPAILEGFARLRSVDPSYRLVFVGPGSGDHQAQAGVINAGHVSDEVLLGLLGTAVACLYPSSYEGFGLPVVEAMASGCPVVTLKTSALRESGGEAAYYLERADADSLERAMLQLSRDDQLRADHVARGLIQARLFQGTGFVDKVRFVIEEQAGLVPTSRRC